MIRVGFVCSFDGGWLGGEHYFRNLLTALYALPDRKIEPVLLTGMNVPAPRFNDSLPAKMLRSRLFDRHTLPWCVRKAWHRSFGHDFFLERLLIKQRIEVLSHSDQLGRRAGIPTLGWIQDFQHRRMPEFFGPLQLAQREKGFAEILACSRLIIVSSSAAQSDLSTFYPRYAKRSRVLQFVADVDPQITCPSLDEIKGKYLITPPYFHLPNHFWVHKNHYVVINALRILKEQGVRVTVLATGNTSDHRWPDHFQSLMAHAEECGVAKEFRVVGVVPYPDLIALMKHSIGLINPSFFEGWSSTVEESKTLGKRVILSDIPVHREQSPVRGVYFNPHDPQELAAAMKQQLDLWNASEDAEWMARAMAELPARRIDFAARYQKIVLELFG